MERHSLVKWAGLAAVVIGASLYAGWGVGTPAYAVVAIGWVALFAGTAMESAWHRNTGYRHFNTSPWIKLWVWTHLAFITIKCLPTAPAEAKGDPPDRKPFGTEYLLIATDRLKPALDLYLWPTGFWQSWDMFAPNPSDWEGYVTAKIFYRDGSFKEVLYPRMKVLPLGIKYFKERYRKFLERAHADAFEWIRPRFALRLAYENYRDPKNPPERVELWRHWFQVPETISAGEYLQNLSDAIRQGKLSLDVISPPNPPMPPYSDVKYFTYIVEQDRLQELAKK